MAVEPERVLRYNSAVSSVPRATEHPIASSRSVSSLVVSWGPAALWAVVLFWLSATPDPPGSGLLDVPAGDKLAHLGLYAVLGLTLARGRRRHLAGAPAAAWMHAALILIGALYGVSDEWHQSFVPGRDASGLDWLADLAGVTLGYSVASVATPDREPPG